jgi:hypothetical protein
MTKQQMKMAVGLGTTTTTKDSKQTDPTTTRPSKTTKLTTILVLLVRGKSLNRFEAEHHRDHCLNSTISTLQNGHGIVIDRERETIPCLNGAASVSVKRYCLNTKPDNIKKARDLLAKLERTS